MGKNGLNSSKKDKFLHSKSSILPQRPEMIWVWHHTGSLQHHILTECTSQTYSVISVLSTAKHSSLLQAVLQSIIRRDTTLIKAFQNHGQKGEHSSPHISKINTSVFFSCTTFTKWVESGIIKLCKHGCVLTGA